MKFEAGVAGFSLVVPRLFFLGGCESEPPVSGIDAPTENGARPAQVSRWL